MIYDAEKRFVSVIILLEEYYQEMKKEAKSLTVIMKMKNLMCSVKKSQVQGNKSKQEVIKILKTADPSSRFHEGSKC
jgi:hypothetical protein